MYYICVRYSLLIFILFLYCKWDMDERWTKGGGKVENNVLMVTFDDFVKTDYLKAGIRYALIKILTTINNIYSTIFV